ncbi:hypothetical protein F3J21_26400 [Burkholderia sp. Tr-860]|uniref:hypothetical protein n=1 Tax=Burkholderia sp. Cy-647 TaxID=2608328 RepID=UPI001424413F|nr:hypothetical protein [Burkholderia sp. Cy-647]NIE86879.1 hypothetical protein [Burkholderia sp. Tr-860]
MHFPAHVFTAHARPFPRGFPAAARRGRPSLDDIGSALTQFLIPFAGDSIGFRAFDSRRMRDSLVAFDKKWDFGVAENRRE